MKKVYPVIFTQIEDCVLVEVPDLKLRTQGKNLEDAVEMAKDAIGLHGMLLEDGNLDIPEPSQNIDIEKGAFATEGKSFIESVEVDFVEYRRTLDEK